MTHSFGQDVTTSLQITTKQNEYETTHLYITTSSGSKQQDTTQMVEKQTTSQKSYTEDKTTNIVGVHSEPTITSVQPSRITTMKTTEYELYTMTTGTSQTTPNTKDITDAPFETSTPFKSDIKTTAMNVFCTTAVPTIEIVHGKDIIITLAFLITAIMSMLILLIVFIYKYKKSRRYIEQTNANLDQVNGELFAMQCADYDIDESYI